LVLTGPNRAVVMNESVIIEAELKVKGPDDEDIYVFAQAAKIKKNQRLVSGRLRLMADVASGASQSPCGLCDRTGPPKLRPPKNIKYILCIII